MSEPDYNDIVYRLRNPTYWFFQIVGPKSGATVHGESDAPREAAGEIERLRAELAAERERRSETFEIAYYKERFRQSELRADALRQVRDGVTAERDTLRAAISSELDDAIQSESWDEVIAVRDRLDAWAKERRG